MERLVVQEDLRSFILNRKKMLRPPKKPCATKKSMGDVFEWTFPLLKGHTLPRLAFIWADLLIAAAEAAAAVDIEVVMVADDMIEDTVVVAADMEAEDAPLHLITAEEVAVETVGITAAEADHIHHVVTERGQTGDCGVLKSLKTIFTI